jgi:hypothetical protein
MHRFARALAVSAAVLFFAGCPNGAGITCPEGEALCLGQCVALGNDVANCGACGNVCPSTLACIQGACGCPVGLSQCGDACVDPMNDPNNCGTCGTACGQDEFCVGGACVFGCPAPLTVCTSAGNVCVDTQNDPNNCGGCGTVCPQFNICCAGTCVSPDTSEHCGSCQACMPGDFCFDMSGLGFMCNAG